MRKRLMKKLLIAKETMAKVGGAAWHRTTLRCHESIPTYCFTCVGCTNETCGCSEEIWQCDTWDECSTVCGSEPGHAC